MKQELIERAVAQVSEWRQKADELEAALKTCELEVTKLLGISPNVDVIQAAVDILRIRGNEPMSVSDFVNPLKQRGIHLTGQDPVANLSSKLSREAAKPDGRLKSNGPRKGYELRDFDQEEIGAQLTDIGL